MMDETRAKQKWSIDFLTIPCWGTTPSFVHSVFIAKCSFRQTSTKGVGRRVISHDGWAMIDLSTCRHTLSIFVLFVANSMKISRGDVFLCDGVWLHRRISFGRLGHLFGFLILTTDSRSKHSARFLSWAPWMELTWDARMRRRINQIDLRCVVSRRQWWGKETTYQRETGIQRRDQSQQSLNHHHGKFLCASPTCFFAYSFWCVDSFWSKLWKWTVRDPARLEPF